MVVTVEFVRFFGLFQRRHAASTVPSEPATVASTTDIPAPQLMALEARVAALEVREAQRSLEHVAAVDQLDRLAKRITARITRAAEKEQVAEPDGESVASLKRRLGR